MTMKEISAARADIEATGDLLERALKLSGLLADLRDFKVLPQLRALKQEISRA